MRGMTELGFEAYSAPADRSYIITAFRYPDDPRFRFEDVSRPSDLGFIIYPGKLSQEACFRIGDDWAIVRSRYRCAAGCHAEGDERDGGYGRAWGWGGKRDYTRVISVQGRLCE